MKYEVVVTLLPIFIDKRYKQDNPNYIKILLDEEEQILKKSVGLLHKDITHCVSELFNEYLKIDYDWPTKTLSGCRKLSRGVIELTYTCGFPYVNGSQKKGNIANINEFNELVSDEYYVESISGNATQFR
jgi:hypothetical protein